MKSFSFINLIVVLLLTQSFAACGNYHSDYIGGNLELIHEKSFPISPGKDLRIKIGGGDIKVTTWDKHEVNIKVFGNENAKEKLEFNFDNSESFVELVTESKNSISNWFKNISFKVEVIVPSEFNSKLHTSGGDVKIEGITGTQEISTSGGDVDCNNFNGIIDASTSGGDITLRGSDTQITAHTSGGDVSLDYSGENMGIDLSTSGGDIKVKLPENFNADMKLSTSGGEVSCNLTMNNASRISEHKIIAELNKGGNEFIAHTSGGDIDVWKK